LLAAGNSVAAQVRFSVDRDVYAALVVMGVALVSVALVIWA
jgi:hypothetical protein